MFLRTSLHEQGSAITPLAFPNPTCIASDRIHFPFYQDQGRISTEKVKPALLAKLQELTKRKIHVAGGVFNLLHYITGDLEGGSITPAHLKLSRDGVT